MLCLQKVRERERGGEAEEQRQGEKKGGDKMGEREKENGKEQKQVKDFKDLKEKVCVREKASSGNFAGQRQIELVYANRLSIEFH